MSPEENCILTQRKYEGLICIITNTKERVNKLQHLILIFFFTFSGIVLRDDTVYRDIFAHWENTREIALRLRGDVVLYIFICIK